MNTELTLSILDDIDECTSDSEFYVIESYMDMLDKDMMIFTESSKKNADMSIGDMMKEYSKNDSNKLVTAITFIPRLITAIAKSIKNKLAKTKMGEVFSSVNNYCNDVKSAKEKRKRVEEINSKVKQYGFEFYYDEVKDKIRLKKSGKRFLILLSWLNAFVLTTYAMVKRLKTAIENKDQTAISKLNNDFKKLISKNANSEHVSAGDMIEDSLDVISETIGHILSIAGELTVLGTGITGLFEYKKILSAAKDDPDDAERSNKFYNDLAETSSYITKIVGIVTATIGSLTVITKWGDIFKDIHHLNKENAATEEMLKHRFDVKGYAKDNILPSKRQEVIDKEREDYINDVEEAYKRILSSKNKEDTPENRKKYVSSGDLDDMVETILQEKGQALEEERQKKSNNTSK